LKVDEGREFVGTSTVELTMNNRSSVIVGILDVAGARGTTQLANIENARNLD
jgi:hypothetical protein